MSIFTHFLQLEAIVARVDKETELVLPSGFTGCKCLVGIETESRSCVTYGKEYSSHWWDRRFQALADLVHNVLGGWKKGRPGMRDVHFKLQAEIKTPVNLALFPSTSPAFHYQLHVASDRKSWASVP